MLFLPGSLTPALLRSCHRKVIYHSDGHLVVGCRRKQKEPITQSTKNRRERGSRFKVMFYVIGSENSKSGSAFFTAPANRTKGVVEQFGIFVAYRCCVGLLRLHYYGSNIFIQLLCSGVPLCHYYTDNVLCRQGCEALSLYSEFQKANFNGCRKVLSTC